jgi:hypothetical protein
MKGIFIEVDSVGSQIGAASIGNFMKRYNPHCKSVEQSLFSSPGQNAAKIRQVRGEHFFVTLNIDIFLNVNELNPPRCVGTALELLRSKTFRALPGVFKL